MLFLNHQIGLPPRLFPDTIPSYAALTGKSVLFTLNHVSFLRFTRVDTALSLVIISNVLIGILRIFLFCAYSHYLVLKNIHHSK